MLTAPSSAFEAGIGAFAVAIIFSAFGYMIASVATARMKLPAATRAGLAFPALVAYCLALMLAHIVTGGRVLSNPAVVRITTVVSLGLLILIHFVRRRRNRMPRAESDRHAVMVLIALLAGATLLWSTPIFRMMALDHVFDTNIHAGWTSQLLNGETTPSATVTGEVPNYYPWLFHAIVAPLTYFTPGERPWHALSPLQLLQLWGLVAAFFALGREVVGRISGGLFAALFGAMTGGVGFVLLDEPDLVLNPRGNGGEAAFTYWGDLIATRPYNLGFQELVPPFPRDVAYTLLFATLLLLVLGLARARYSLLVAGGACVGLLGLTGGESFLVGFAVLVLLCPFATEVGRFRYALAVFPSAVAVSALWWAPLVVNYVRYGGFFGSAADPVTLTPAAILAAWGIVTPFAVYGIVRAVLRYRQHPRVKVFAVLLATAGIFVVVTAVLPVILGRGFNTLDRPHRYWPLVYAALALFASVGAAHAWEWLSRRRKWLPAVLLVGVVALAFPSPLAASVALPKKRGQPQDLVASLKGNPDTLLNRLAPEPGMRCVAAAPVDISQRVFSYTGYRMIVFRWTKTLRWNSARIRWRLIYRHIPSIRERVPANEQLTRGLGSTSEWNRLADRWGVDVVVAVSGAANSPAFRDAEVMRTTDPRFVVVWRRPCRD